MRPLFLPLPAGVLLVALAAAAPGAIAAAQDDEGSDKSCVRVMGQLVCKSRSTPAAAAASPALVAARLFADGPLFSPRSDPRNFAVQGFVRRGWPVAVDFQPQPGTRTILVVTPNETPARGALTDAARAAVGRKPPLAPLRVVMDADGKGGRRLFILPRLDVAPAPGAGGDRPLGIATYSVESRRILAGGKLSLKRSPVEIFGFGAGPDSVVGATAARRGWAPGRAAAALAAAAPIPATMSLTQLVLGNRPPTLARPRGKARLNVAYAYNLRRKFHLVREEIWRECGGKACGQPVFSRPLTDQKPLAPLRNHWILKAEDKAGLYRLYVRAWLRCDTPDFRKCADQAAFSFGRSAALRIE
jgi:hypothetical protein